MGCKEGEGGGDLAGVVVGMRDDGAHAANGGFAVGWHGHRHGRREAGGGRWGGGAAARAPRQAGRQRAGATARVRGRAAGQRGGGGENRRQHLLDRLRACTVHALQSQLVGCIRRAPLVPFRFVLFRVASLGCFPCQLLTLPIGWRVPLTTTHLPAPASRILVTAAAAFSPFEIVLCRIPRSLTSMELPVTTASPPPRPPPPPSPSPRSSRMLLSPSRTLSGPLARTSPCVPAQRMAGATPVPLPSPSRPPPPPPPLPLASARAAARHRIAAVDRRAVAPALVDRHARAHTYLRLSLTERCNLRCSYCMPADGVGLTPSDELLTSDELVRLARLFVRSGVTKLRLTGGEPTVRRDLLDILSTSPRLRLAPDPSQSKRQFPHRRRLVGRTNGLTEPVITRLARPQLCWASSAPTALSQSA